MNNKQSGFNWHQFLYQLSISTRQSTPKLSNLWWWPFFYLRIFLISWVVFISRLIFTTLSHVCGAADIFVMVKWSCMTSHFWWLIWSWLSNWTELRVLYPLHGLPSLSRLTYTLLVSNFWSGQTCFKALFMLPFYFSVL